MRNLFVLLVLVLAVDVYAFNLKKLVKDAVKEEVKEAVAPGEEPAKTETVTESKEKKDKAAAEVKAPEKDPSTAGRSRIHDAKAGFKILLPGGWVAAQDEAGSFRADLKSKPGVAVSVIVNDYGAGFPVDASLKAYIDRAHQEKKDGKIEDCENLQLGKAKGITRTENAPADGDDVRRITYQGYAGTKGINIVASSRGADFKKYQATFNKIIKSIKF